MARYSQREFNNSACCDAVDKSPKKSIILRDLVVQKTLTKQEILERVAKAKKMREAADYKPVILIPAILLPVIELIQVDWIDILGSFFSLIEVDGSNDSKGYKHGANYHEFFGTSVLDRINNPCDAEYLPFGWERD